MPKVSKDSATRGGDYGPVVDRNDEVEGYRIGFTTFKENIDGTPLMKGLPDDRCQCPHWGCRRCMPDLYTRTFVIQVIT